MANLTETAPDIKGGYWLSKQAGQCPPADIPSYFTHVFYASVGLDPQNYSIIITGIDEQWMPKFTSALRAKKIKSFLSIGGRPDSEIPNPLPGIFSSMARTAAGRQSFIQSSIQVARDNGFDGLDLDWEYPKNPKDNTENFWLLLREWRDAISSEAAKNGQTQLLLSAAVYFKPSLSSNTIDAIRVCVDLVGLRCFDFHTSRDTPVTAEPASFDETCDSIESWIAAGLHPSKLVLGLPLYGRTWTLQDPNQHGIGAPAIENVMPYHDILNCHLQSAYDEGTVSEYSYSGTFWVGYDGPRTIRKKLEFARSQSIRGYFLWAIGFDNRFMLSEAASNAWDGANNR